MIMKKVVAIILMVCMCFGLVGEHIKAIANVNQSMVSIFTGSDFEVRFEISSIWDKGYIGNVCIKNIGPNVIENWELSYQSFDEYTNIWNATVDYRGAKYYNIKNAGHNQNIKPGDMVSYGFQASFNGENPDIPDKYSLIGDHLIVSTNDCVPKFEIVNSWNNGCIMNVSLYNNSDNNIEDWSLDCTFDFTIDNIWRALISDKRENRYTFKNCEYNSVIKPGETETFGMQISFPEGSVFQNPYSVVLKQYRKDDFYMDFDKNWNNTMIRADDARVQAAREKNKNTVKVCIIDSGIDYSSNIDVCDSFNFVEAYSEKNPIFSDLSGHGTAVAGILASDSTKNDDVYEFDNKYLKKLTSEKINGVNPYVKLYSAEVLDENNVTTVEQMIKGIEWAIERDVNIINISCGLEKDSKKLYEAIKKAYNKGILIIAAAGDGETIQYPAKYEEVMAVGAVKCDATLMKSSPKGKEIEVVAPGEDVTTYGSFGILTNASGTSMAAPHVSALAAILWQQDITKSADFIRELIKSTARSLGESNKYGAGLIDCVYAIEKYDDLSKRFISPTTQDAIENNGNSLLLFDDSEVKGFWKSAEHEGTVRERMREVKMGATWPDNKGSGVSGMKKNPKFHGYYKADYVAAIIDITKLAKKVSKNGNYLKKKKKLSVYEKAALTGINSNKISGKEQMGAFIYGMALHTAADIFAHSATGVRWSCGSDIKKLNKSELKEKRRRVLMKKSAKALAKKWNTFKHGPRDENNKFYPEKNMADSVFCVDRRYNKGAKIICNAIINQAYVEKKIATKAVFCNVKYYKKVSVASNLKKTKSDVKKKKTYLVNSYGILGLETYLKPGNNKKLKSIVKNLSNNKIKKVVEQWAD